MHDLQRVRLPNYYCIDNPTYDDYVANGYQAIGCGSPLTFFYFMSFFLLFTLVFINIFIAIILQGFQDISKREDMIVTDKALEDFKRAWKEFDP